MHQRPKKIVYKPVGAGGARSNAAGRTNTLGLTGQELDNLYNVLDAGANGRTHRRRQATRLMYRYDNVPLEIIQPGGGQTIIRVACRNLSRGGLGFLHSAFVHTGTRVVATLMSRTGESVRFPGKIVRCSHVTRHIHDVGVKFDDPVTVRDFMSTDTLNQAFTCEVVEPSELKGVALVIAEYRIEQACVLSMLRETSMDFVTAASVEEGISHARKGVEVIICDDAFERSSGIEFVARARKSGIRTPVILMSGDASEANLDAIRKSDVDAFLAKPLNHDLLLRAIAEFLLVSTNRLETASPVYSSLPPNSPLADLADDFVEDLKTFADDLEQLAQGNDLTSIRKRALRIGGPATSLGFGPIANLSAALVGSLDATQSVEESIVALNTLVSACRSVRRAAKAA